MSSLFIGWHGPTGHFYGSLVDDPSESPSGGHMFEIAARSVEDPSKATGKKFSWGVPATNERVLSHFENYDPRVKEALTYVPEGQWKEFSAFAGPRLEGLTGWGKVVLSMLSHFGFGSCNTGSWLIYRSQLVMQAIHFRARSAPELHSHSKTPGSWRGRLSTRAPRLLLFPLLFRSSILSDRLTILGCKPCSFSNHLYQR